MTDESDSILVFDVETVPNWKIADKLTPPRDIPRDKDADIAIGLSGYNPDYLKWMATTPAYCEIATIGCMISVGGKRGVRFFDVANNTTEANALQRFWETTKKCPTIVTFNGMGFDVPLLNYRSRVNQVKPSRQISTYPYGDPVSHGHYDLFNETFRRGTPGSTLGNLAVALGVEDTEEADGSIVAGLVREQRWDRLHQYNYNDLRITAQCWQKLYDPENLSGFASLPLQYEPPKVLV